MSKITMNDSVTDVIVKMSEGNPGAISALTEILNETPSVDPENLLGGLAPILDLDMLGIYGSGIYVLWSDKCGKDTRKLLMLLRAHQLGEADAQEITAMASDQSRNISLSDERWNELDSFVCNRLIKFRRPVPA